MTTFTLATGPSTWVLQEVLNDEMFQAITGAYQVEARTGNRWSLVLTYENMQGTRRKAIEAFRRSLQGRIHRAKVQMSTLGYVRTGSGGGTPLLVGAHSAGARSLSIDGASINITNWLTGADYITVGNELKAVTAAVNTNGSGAATISIWPELHQNYSDNAAVNISTPFGVFLQADVPSIGPHTPYQSGEPLLASMMFSLIEDVLA